LDEVLDLFVIVVIVGGRGSDWGLLGFLKGVACFLGSFVERAGGISGEGGEVRVACCGFMEGEVGEVAEGVASVLVAFGVLRAGEAGGLLGYAADAVLEVGGWQFG
jgi:hypothetical protein